MKNALQLRLSQHLTLTPQLQQSIRLLQLSTLDLNQELERFLQENPLLEREDDGDPALEPLPGGALAGEQPGIMAAEPAAAEARNDDRPTDQAAEHGDGFEFDGVPTPTGHPTKAASAPATPTKTASTRSRSPAPPRCANTCSASCR